MSQNNDNRNAEHGHQFTLLPEGAPLPAWRQITSVVLVPFDRQGLLVLADLAHRGVDLPGGHVEPEDTSPEQTARREAAEEICAEVGPLQVVTAIQSSMQKNGAPTAMLVMTGPVTSFNALKFAPDEKSRGRVLMAPGQFLASYRGGLEQGLLAGVIERAVRTYQPPQGYAVPVLRNA